MRTNQIGCFVRFPKLDGQVMKVVGQDGQMLTCEWCDATGAVRRVTLHGGLTMLLAPPSVGPHTVAVR